MVFNFGLGQSRLFHRRPHDRFRSLIKRAVHDELHEFLGDHTFGMEIHCKIGFWPVSRDTQALEFLALDINPVRRELSAFAPEIIDRHFVFVFTFLAVLLFDFPLDGQAVTVPARDISGIKPHHLM